MSRIGLGHKILCWLEEADRLVLNRPQPFVTCEIDLSNYCQNRCSFCMFSDYLASHRTFLPFKVGMRALTELTRLGTKSVTFTGGGEPLTNPHVKGLLAWAKKCKMDVGLVTNGIMLDEFVDCLEDFRYIRISLNAASYDTYKSIMHTSFFPKVLANIEKVVAAGYEDLGIAMVVTDENRHEVEKFKALGKELGVAYVQVKPSVTEGNVETSLQDIPDSGAFLTERYKVEGTTACKLAGLVGILCADQKMYYCCIHRGNPDFEIGDLRKDTPAEIIRKRVYFKPDLSQCNSCRYMNYAKVYEEVRDRRFTVLRHRNFV